MKPVLESVTRPVGKAGAVVLTVLLSTAVLLLPLSRGADARERKALVTVSVNLASPLPAEVRKAILERKITVEEARPLREYYFGAVDESR